MRNTSTKHCYTCELDKATTAFNKNKTTRDGVQGRCRDCEKHHYQQNKQRIRTKYYQRYHDLSGFHWKMRLRSYGAPEVAEAFYQKYLDHPNCTYCDLALTPSDIQIDHMIPRSRGGSNALDNLAVACADCNRLKHNKTSEEFVIFLRSYAARFLGNEAEAANAVGGHRERLSELAPAAQQDDATVCSHGNNNHERSAEMTDPVTIH